MDCLCHLCEALVLHSVDWVEILQSLSNHAKLLLELIFGICGLTKLILVVSVVAMLLLELGILFLESQVLMLQISLLLLCKLFALLSEVELFLRDSFSELFEENSKLID